MRLINELRTVTIHASATRRVAAIVRVQGIDLRFGGRGLLYERREPSAILVRDPDKVRRVALQPERASGRALVFLATPLLAMAAVRLLSENNS